MGELREREPGMMLLVGMAITVAFVSSLATTLGLVDLVDFWWEMALLVTVMLLGHWLEMRALGQARGALAALAELRPDEAERGVDVPAAEGFRALAGRGVQATVAGEAVAVGGPALLREQGLDEPAALADAAEDWRRRGAAVLYAVRDGEVIGALALADQVAPSPGRPSPRCVAPGWPSP